MSLPLETIQAIASDLDGTCQDFEKVLQQHGIESEDDLTPEDCSALDDLVMLCDTCGWWVGSDEMGDDQTCIECEEDNEGDE